MVLHSDSFRELTRRAMELADRHCQGRLAIVRDEAFKAQQSTAKFAIEDGMNCGMPRAPA